MSDNLLFGKSLIEETDLPIPLIGIDTKRPENCAECLYYLKSCNGCRRKRGGVCDIGRKMSEPPERVCLSVRTDRGRKEGIA